MENKYEEAVSSVLKWGPAALILIIVIWAGSKGYWYWGTSVRGMITHVEQERDQWRNIALALMKEKGIPLPPNPEITSITKLVNGK